MVSKERPKRLVLFDAHAIIHRAYHALPDFATKAGEPTGGLYGLATMLMRAIAEFEPDYMAACYDLPGPTFRHKEYKEYKAGRKKADDELKHQLERSRAVFSAFHIPIYDAPGFEADDMLGTIVAQTKKEKDLEVLIVTGDMDTLQLVDGKRVRVYTSFGMKSEITVRGIDRVRFRLSTVSSTDMRILLAVNGVKGLIVQE
jgi:DNA polymerase-1